MHCGVLMYPVYYALNKNTEHMPFGFKIMSIVIAIVMPIVIIIKKMLDLFRKRTRR